MVSSFGRISALFIPLPLQLAVPSLTRMLSGLSCLRGDREIGHGILLHPIRKLRESSREEGRLQNLGSILRNRHHHSLCDCESKCSQSTDRHTSWSGHQQAAAWTPKAPLPLLDATDEQSQIPAIRKVRKRVQLEPNIAIHAHTLTSLT